MLTWRGEGERERGGEAERERGREGERGRAGSFSHFSWTRMFRGGGDDPSDDT